MRSDPLDHPSVQRLARVARALGVLRERIVFIGGAIAPLLHTERQIRSPRATKDIDGVCVTTTYTAHGTLQQELRRRGFTEETDAGPLAHRWRSPQGDLFDLVPTGNVLGATGQVWDMSAAVSAQPIQLEPDLVVRIPSAPAFLALKWAAFEDRGAEDPLASSDLEDIIGLIVSRPTIDREIESADPSVRAFVGSHAGTFLANRNLEDLLAAHLNGALDPASAVNTARVRLQLIAALRNLG